MAHTYIILLLAVILYATNATGGTSDDTTGFALERLRRGRMQIFEHIIDHATYLFRSPSGEQVYIREGGLKQARADFYAADPENVRDLIIGTGKEGSVGDKLIQLHKTDGFSPSLSIQSKRLNFPDVRIIYRD